MPNVAITIPDDWAPQVVRAMKRRYPDLIGTDGIVVREGIARIVREVLRSSEADKISDSLQAELEAERLRRLSLVDSVLAQIL